METHEPSQLGLTIPFPFPILLVSLLISYPLLLSPAATTYSWTYPTLILWPPSPISSYRRREDLRVRSVALFFQEVKLFEEPLQSSKWIVFRIKLNCFGTFDSMTFPLVHSVNWWTWTWLPGVCSLCSFPSPYFEGENRCFTLFQQ